MVRIDALFPEDMLEKLDSVAHAFWPYHRLRRSLL